MFFSLEANFPVSSAAIADAIGKTSVKTKAALPFSFIFRPKASAVPITARRKWRRGFGEVGCVDIDYTKYSLRRQQPRQMSRLGFRSIALGACGAAALVCFSVTLSLPSSMRVENFTEPSSEISTRGVVPLMPMVATGVSTFMSPDFAILPATKVNVPLVRLSRVEFDLLFGS